MSDITVYTAARIITMNPSFPEGRAIAVRNGKILEVGELKRMKPWLETGTYRVDDSFSEMVILPGFIDPHLHPSMAAVLLPMHFVTAMEWRLPWEHVTPVRSYEAFMSKLRELHERLEPEEPLFVWGYHQHWHGSVQRKAINTISRKRPIIVWHRSFHEFFLNDGALNWLGLTRDVVGNASQVDYESGHFFEAGKALAMQRLNPHILSPERFREGLVRLREVVHLGGHTTIGDMATGMFDFDMEWAAMKEFLEGSEVPFRTECVAIGGQLGQLSENPEEVRAKIDLLPALNTHRLNFRRRVKLFCDGAFFSQLAQMNPPGYISGRSGEWMMSPEALEAFAREFWRHNYKIHVHTTGDLGLELVLDIVSRLQSEYPRFDHGFTIEHFGFSNPEQVARMAKLGMSVSCNAYYLYELSGSYARHGIGYERASQMSRVGSAVRAGLATALHSDFTMAPANPLNHAWIAANRINVEGEVMAPEERLSVYQALRAITSHAANILGIDDEVGSLRSGKSADFTILKDDPFAAGAGGLRDMDIVATVFEGAVHELRSSAFL